MRYPTITALLLLGFFASAEVFAQYPAACDADKSCIGKALHQTRTTGRAAQYVRLRRTTSMTNISTAMTVEMWIKPEKQAGFRQFLGGLWGPRADENDVWVLYIDKNDDLVFEINHPTQKLGAADNTIVRFPAGSMYGAWNHIAAVFDGSTQSAWFVINGTQYAAVRNAAYPASKLFALTDPNLLTLIGSCNSLDNDQSFATFKGWMDEIRVWNRVLGSSEIYCGKDKSLRGNETGLVAYFRCNDASAQLCDATGNANFGEMLSGATCDATGNRSFASLITAAADVGVKLTDTLRCDSVRAFTFVVSTASICVDTVRVTMSNREAANFTVTPSTIPLTPGVPATFTVTFRGNLIGSILGDVNINSLNTCRQQITLPIRLERITEIAYNYSKVKVMNFDTLFVGCSNIPYRDVALVIYNKSAESGGTARTVTINDIRVSNSPAFSIIYPKGKPFSIPAGQCDSIFVRFSQIDTTLVINDSIKVYTDDVCSGPRAIPIRGVLQRLVAFLDPGGKNLRDTAKFGVECVGFSTNSVPFVWKNLTSTRDIIIDTIIVPPHFRTRLDGGVRFPVTLKPNTGYRPNYFYFNPTSPGVKDSVMIIRAHVSGMAGCVIEKKIYVFGRGFQAQVQFNLDSVDFGNVVVGRDTTIMISAKNLSILDTLNLGFFLETGEAFVFVGGKGISLKPGETRSIPVTFKPIDTLLYRDRLCFMETRCYTVDCLKLKGKGILQTFQFEPLLMRTENVLGCGSRLDTLAIRNITSLPQMIDSVQMIDASGKFQQIFPVPAVSPAVLSRTIPAGDTVQFIFRFTPAVLNSDIAVRAYLRYKFKGEKWEAQLVGASQSPRLGITSLTVFGAVEVGDFRRDTVLLENISNLRVRVDSSAIKLSQGFSITKFITFPKDSTLNPRDSILMQVEFRPTLEQMYNGTITAVSKNPCDSIVVKGDLKGEGFIPKFLPGLTTIIFGYVRPCAERTIEVPLQNGSLVLPVMVDSIKINGANPEFFSWNSVVGGTSSSYSIPKNSWDTLKITYRPRTPSDNMFINHSARLHLWAHSEDTQGKVIPSSVTLYEPYLGGKRMLTMKPTPTTATFFPTPVDTLATPRFSNITIPPVSLNPEREKLQLDSITFEPDDRVFSVEFDSLGKRLDFPVTVDTNQTLKLRIDFLPRAPRLYVARMVLHFSKPCYDRDTTILVQGIGYARPISRDFLFKENGKEALLYTITTCDTAKVKVYIDQPMPLSLQGESVVDIKGRIGYDMTKFQFVGATSAYISAPCPGYTPDITWGASPFGGTEVRLKNFCNVDSLKPLFTAHLIPLTNQRVNLPISYDSVSFDTQDILLFDVHPGTASSRIQTVKPEMKVLNWADFGSVRVLDCSTQTIVVQNTGDVPISLDALLQLPPDVKIISSVPALKTGMIATGATIVLTLEYCPSKMDTMSAKTYVQSVNPCPLSDSTNIAGSGYAPDFPVLFALSSNIAAPTALGGMLGDTVVVPLYVEKDFSALYHGVEYWLQGLKFDVGVEYNPRMLKFISAKSPLDPKMTLTATLGKLDFAFADVDSVRAGKIADLTFVVTVPDSVETKLDVSAGNFRTDSLMFLNILAGGKQSVFGTNGKCNITVARYTNASPRLYQNAPNPFSDLTSVTFETQEEVPAELKLYSMTGEIKKILLDGKTTLKAGKYTVEMRADDLPAGVYYYVLRSGIFNDTKRMVIMK